MVSGTQLIISVFNTFKIISPTPLKQVVILTTSLYALSDILKALYVQIRR